MADQTVAHDDRPLVSALAHGSVEYAHSDRIHSLIGPRIPTQLPARLFRWILMRCPKPPREETTADAELALEWSSLHHFLHSIPNADGPLLSTVATSPYADDPSGALLDGDFAHARAFARLGRIERQPSRTQECMRALAAASRDQYVFTVGDSRPTGPIRLVGCGGWMAAVLGGIDGAVVDHIDRLARAVGAAVPMPGPCEWSADSMGPDVDSRLRRLEDAIPGDAAPDRGQPVEEPTGWRLAMKYSLSTAFEHRR